MRICCVDLVAHCFLMVLYDYTVFQYVLLVLGFPALAYDLVYLWPVYDRPSRDGPFLLALQRSGSNLLKTWPSPPSWCLSPFCW